MASQETSKYPHLETMNSDQPKVHFDKVLRGLITDLKKIGIDLDVSIENYRQQYLFSREGESGKPKSSSKVTVKLIVNQEGSLKDNPVELDNLNQSIARIINIIYLYGPLEVADRPSINQIESNNTAIVKPNFEVDQLKHLFPTTLFEFVITIDNTLVNKAEINSIDEHNNFKGSNPQSLKQNQLIVDLINVMQDKGWAALPQNPNIKPNIVAGFCFVGHKRVHEVNLANTVNVLAGRLFTLNKGRLPDYNFLQNHHRCSGREDTLEISEFRYRNTSNINKLLELGYNIYSLQQFRSLELSDPNIYRYLLESLKKSFTNIFKYSSGEKVQSDEGVNFDDFPFTDFRVITDQNHNLIAHVARYGSMLAYLGSAVQAKLTNITGEKINYHKLVNLNSLAQLNNDNVYVPPGIGAVLMLDIIISAQLQDKNSIVWATFMAPGEVQSRINEWGAPLHNLNPESLRKIFKNSGIYTASFFGGQILGVTPARDRSNNDVSRTNPNKDSNSQIKDSEWGKAGVSKALQISPRITVAFPSYI